MKYLEVKEIKVEPDLREENILERDSSGKPIKFKQSKCTCQIYLENNNGEKYIWVAKNENLANAIELIAQNEEKKYKAFGTVPIPEKEVFEYPSGKFLLGRFMFFLGWLYPIYDKFLIKHGLMVPEKYIKQAIENKEKEKNANKN